jgi:hypothetical protein
MNIRSCSNQAVLDLWSIGNIQTTLFYLQQLESAIELKTRDNLPLEDIDELIRIKADTLHAACLHGVVRPTSYRDAIKRFRPFPENGQYVFERFFEVIDPRFLQFFPNCADELDEVLDHAERFLGRRLCRMDLKDTNLGQEVVNDIKRVHEGYFTQLTERAVETRKAIPFEKIEDLLFDMDERAYGAWRLDPEYQSVVGFTYEDADVRLIFRLPFRLAESFLDAEVLRSLPAIEKAAYGTLKAPSPVQQNDNNIHHIVSCLGNYYMDSLVMAVFVEEILRQCSFSLFALADMEDLLGQTIEPKSSEERRFWFSVHALLCAIANISKILWSAEARGKSRASKLRNILEVDDNSPFRSRNFRNHFEHWDERMDTWAVSLDGLENRWFVDGEIGSSDDVNFTDPAYTLRNFNKTNFAVTFQGEMYELRPVKEAILALHERANEVFKTVPYCM